MAAPVVHIVLAIAFLSGPAQNVRVNEKEFILGTSFSDIRYIARGVKREVTHIPRVKFKDVYGQLKAGNSFWAGVLFHSLVDEMREWYMTEMVKKKRCCLCCRWPWGKRGVYSYVPESIWIAHCLKFNEDIRLQARLSEQARKRIVAYFSDEVPLVERVFAEQIGIPKLEVLGVITRWHKMIREYCSNELTDRSIEQFVGYVIPKKDLRVKIMSLLETVKHVPELEDIVSNFYDFMRWRMAQEKFEDRQERKRRTSILVQGHEQVIHEHAS